MNLDNPPTRPPSGSYKRDIIKTRELFDKYSHIEEKLLSFNELEIYRSPHRYSEEDFKSIWYKLWEKNLVVWTTVGESYHNKCIGLYGQPVITNSSESRVLIPESFGSGDGFKVTGHFIRGKVGLTDEIIKNNRNLDPRDINIGVNISLHEFFDFIPPLKISQRALHISRPNALYVTNINYPVSTSPPIFYGRTKSHRGEINVKLYSDGKTKSVIDSGTLELLPTSYLYRFNYHKNVNSYYTASPPVHFTVRGSISRYMNVPNALIRVDINGKYFYYILPDNIIDYNALESNNIKVIFRSNNGFKLKNLIPIGNIEKLKINNIDEDYKYLFYMFILRLGMVDIGGKFNDNSITLPNIFAPVSMLDNTIDKSLTIYDIEDNLDPIINIINRNSENTIKLSIDLPSEPSTSRISTLSGSIPDTSDDYRDISNLDGHGKSYDDIDDIINLYSEMGVSDPDGDPIGDPDEDSDEVETIIFTLPPNLTMGKNSDYFIGITELLDKETYNDDLWKISCWKDSSKLPTKEELKSLYNVDLDKFLWYIIIKSEDDIYMYKSRRDINQNDVVKLLKSYNLIPDNGYVFYGYGDNDISLRKISKYTPSHIVTVKDESESLIKYNLTHMNLIKDEKIAIFSGDDDNKILGKLKGSIGNEIKEKMDYIAVVSEMGNNIEVIHNRLDINDIKFSLSEYYNRISKVHGLKFNLSDKIILFRLSYASSELIVPNDLLQLKSSEFLCKDIIEPLKNPGRHTEIDFDVTINKPVDYKNKRDKVLNVPDNIPFRSAMVRKPILNDKEIFHGESLFVDDIDINEEVEFIKREYIPNTNNPSAHLKEVRDIYHSIGSVFAFPDERTQRLSIASALNPDWVTVFKGIPGTGKTVLVSTLSLSFMNDIDYNTELEGIYKKYNSNNMERYFRDTFVWGIAKHNKDKDPDEVFYETQISMIKKEFNTGNGAKTNPGDIKGLVEMRKFLEEHPGIPVSREDYTFTPKRKPIVSSIIKFHNEANRMNSNVADVLLGLIEEKQVEYLGSPMDSPQFGKSFPCLHYLDYNPHLDMDFELDRALLDRINMGIYLRQPTIDNRNNILMMQYKTGGLKVQDQMIDLFRPKHLKINNNNDINIKALSYLELQEIWNIVTQIPISEFQITLVNLVTFYFSTMYAKYNIESNTYTDPGNINLNYVDENFRKMVLNILGKYTYKERDIDGDIKYTGSFIDTSTITYKLSKTTEGAVDTVFSSIPTDVSRYINAVDRELGMRSAKSMIRLLQSYCYIDTAISGKEVKSINDYKIKTDWIIELLSVIMDHRINIGVTNPINNSFMCFADFIEGYFIPIVLIGKDEVSRPPLWERWKLWSEALLVTDTQKQMFEYVLERSEEYAEIGERENIEHLKIFSNYIEDTIKEDIREEVSIAMLYHSKRKEML